jgi:tetratricopeptide (TPR) repeat protein
MLSRLAASVALIVLTVVPVHAAILKGVVVVDEDKGPGMDNVPISVDEATANSIVSKEGGHFAFAFPEKQAGETVHVRVNKEGYVVVNDVQLEVTIPANPDTKLLTIILSKAEDREEMARRYYGLKSSDVINETYKKQKKQIKELQDTHQDTQQATAAKLTKLQQKRNQAEAATEKNAEGLAKNRPGQSSQLYWQAMRLFLDGKSDEAIQFLNDEKLRRSVAQAKQTIGDAVQAWLLKAQLLTTQFRFEEADKAYLQAIDAKPDSFEANFAYARFSQSLNRVDKARAAYMRCLRIAKETGKDADCAATLNNLGMLDTDQNRLSEAESAFTEALKIYGETPHKEPEARASYGASTLNNRGIVYQKEGKMKAAREDFEEALHTYQDLAREHGDAYVPDLARTLNNLGVLNQQEGQTEEARKNFDEALQIRRALTQKNPETYSPDVATTLNNLGVLDRTQDRLEEARKNFEEALQIRRALTQKNPDTYLLDLALTLNNLGDLSRAQNRVKESRQEFWDALQSYETLTKQDPERFSSEVERVKKVLDELQKTQAP